MHDGPVLAGSPGFWTGTIRPFSPRAELPLYRSWSALAREAPPFLRPEFFALERRLLGGADPLVVVAYGGGELAGALPLLRRGRTLEALRSEHAPAYDYVGDPEALAGVWQALVGDPGWDTLVLSGVPAGSPLTVRLPGLALRDLCLTAVRPAARSPYFALPGFEARLSSKMKQNLRRCANKLGALELERITDFSRAAFDEGLSLEAAAWKGAAGTSISASPELRHFYLALARLSARRGELALYYLRAGGKRIAFLFALEDEREVYALKVGYDPAFAEFSPGHLLFAQVARDAEGRGLLELDFMGRADEWKRRWTDLAHEQVSLVVYRSSARGAATLLARELLMPRLPLRWQATATRARRELDTRRRPCQRRDVIGVHVPLARVVGRLREGLGLRSGARRVLGPPVAPQGTPSAFAPGQWVRIKDRADVRATLDGADKLRGLRFMPAQWGTCGQVYKVSKALRRLVDDCGQPRAVHRTVLLEGVTCDHPGRHTPDQPGCGRCCPLIYRDEWLEAAAAPEATTPAAPEATAPVWTRVRSLDAIRATLSADGRRDGLTFLPEMGRFAGARLPLLRRLERVFELDAWVPTRAPVYLLDGATCTGRDLDQDAPCDRACTLLWHGDWLTLEQGSFHPKEES